MGQAAQHVKALLSRPPRYEGSMNAWVEDDLEAPAWVDKSLLAHAYLLAEEWDAAHQLAARQEVLGWSSSDNPQGLVVPFFLVLLSGKSAAALPSGLTDLWQWVLRHGIGFDFWSEGEETDMLKRLERAHAQVIAQASLGSSQSEKILSWCVDVAKRRAIAIVEHRRRKSYDKAAVLLAGCADTLRLRGNDKAADSLLNDLRTRFPRHRAFQTELNKAVPSMPRRTPARSSGSAL